MSFWATNGLFIFLQLGLVLCSIGTPVPLPRGQGGALAIGRWGVPLPQREGLPPVVTCAPQLEWSRDCLGQDATFHPLGLSCLRTG